jgi:hypothetical protein
MFAIWRIPHSLYINEKCLVVHKAFHIYCIFIGSGIFISTGGCRANQFQCKTSKKCISKRLVCNNKKNCKDGSDEEGCKWLDKKLSQLMDCPLPTNNTHIIMSTNITHTQI